MGKEIKALHLQHENHILILFGLFISYLLIIPVILPVKSVGNSLQYNSGRISKCNYKIIQLSHKFDRPRSEYVAHENKSKTSQSVSSFETG